MHLAVAHFLGKSLSEVAAMTVAEIELWLAYMDLLQDKEKPRR